LKLRILYVLKNEGFIRNFKVIQDDKQDVICVYLKYADDKSPAIMQLERASKPGRRSYVKSSALPRVRNRLGVAIISTSQGVMTGTQAESLGIGGEHICNVW
jgi:small subunit ribosomal protein S8